jgi:hypothetical protein
MIDWPKPSTVKGLRGFLGLTCYYRKCPKLWHNCRSSYNYVTQGLIQMDRGCNSRIWAIKNFYAMHPYFGTTQLHHTVHFGMWCLRYKNESSVTTRKSTNCIFHQTSFIPLQKSSGLWEGAHWLSQNSQTLASIFVGVPLPCPNRPLQPQVFIGIVQKHWLCKLMGFNFAVEYRAGKQNKVADALSLRLEDQPSLA